jgi:phenylalanyl-tRNA synthetase alpha chain
MYLMLRGDWRNIEFKEYNFSAKGPPPESGHLHPLNKARITLFLF